MRLTFAVYLEISADYLLPGFFQSLRQFNFGQSVSAGDCRMRQEIFRLEFENVKGTEAEVRQVAERAALAQIPAIERRFELPNGWQDHGQLAVDLVDNAPNPTWTHGMEGDDHSVRCPVCQSPMKRKQGNNGPFYGCSRFPECRGSRRISK
jgi:hypothetical protein